MDQHPPATLPPILWGDAVAVPADERLSWLWHGYLARGNVTLMTSRWKSGKSTLISLLLARMAAGGQLAGLAVAPGRAVVLSEESRTTWDARREKLAIGSHVGFLCRPFRGRPTAEEWRCLLDHLAAVRARDGLDLAVVDPLAFFLPARSEGHAAALLDCLRPLHDLAARGVSVLLTHHPSKGPFLPGQAARGSGALSGFADILIEKDWPGLPDPLDRRRRLLAFSRHEQTTRQLVIELNEGGTDYLVHGDFQADEFTTGWATLRLVFEDSWRKMTRRDILNDWPPDFPKPAAATLWRWLERAVARGLLLRDGTGHKEDPFRYWRPGDEERWRDDSRCPRDPRDLLRELQRKLWPARPANTNPPQPGQPSDGR